MGKWFENEIITFKSLKEGYPLSSKTVLPTNTSYSHLIGLAEMYLSEFDPQIASKINLAGFQMITPDSRCAG